MFFLYHDGNCKILRKTQCRIGLERNQTHLNHCILHLSSKNEVNNEAGNLL